MIDQNLLNEIAGVKVDMTEKQMLNRLLDRFRWPKRYSMAPLTGMPSVEAINEDGSKDENFFSHDNFLDSVECIKRYNDGYSLILSAVGGICLGTWQIQQMLNKRLNKYVNCNLYFGNGKKSVSFEKHNHHYPVIVKNIYGKSKWIIDEKEVYLQNQDVIFFDKGTDHQVVEIYDAKLSLTCNIE
jgi:mannose-6-phosphate isomerase-like protein (cupin superfamily)|tara:strand:+ start:6153 stop:6707 length:555 start_codon:yes stop_codon:yes gene_type:complete